MSKAISCWRPPFFCFFPCRPQGRYKTRQEKPPEKNKEKGSFCPAGGGRGLPITRTPTPALKNQGKKKSFGRSLIKKKERKNGENPPSPLTTPRPPSPPSPPSGCLNAVWAPKESCPCQRGKHLVYPSVGWSLKEEEASFKNSAAKLKKSRKNRGKTDGRSLKVRKNCVIVIIGWF